jgi:hypothetical protein
VFDPVKQRVKGTEAEVFLKKGQPQAVPVSIVMYHKHTEGWGSGTSGLQAAINYKIFKLLKCRNIDKVTSLKFTIWTFIIIPQSLHVGNLLYVPFI